MNCGPLPGSDKVGIPKPTLCSVAVPAFDKHTSAILTQALKLPRPNNKNILFFFQTDFSPREKVFSLSLKNL